MEVLPGCEEGKAKIMSKAAKLTRKTSKKMENFKEDERDLRSPSEMPNETSRRPSRIARRKNEKSRLGEQLKN